MMATRLRLRLRKVRKRISNVRLNDRPSSGPAIRPAMKVPVPGVESQEMSNMAGSAYDLRTAGGCRIPGRWSPGSGCFQEKESRNLVTGAKFLDSFSWKQPVPGLHLLV